MSSVNIGDIAGCLHKGTGYIGVTINGKNHQAHRLAWLYMTGKWPKHHIDHDDHIRCNNKWDNLNAATSQENNKNRSKMKNNTSGVTGVSWFKAGKKWHAQITVGKKKKHLGFFTDKLEAVCARKSAEIKHGFHQNHGA